MYTRICRKCQIQFETQHEKTENAICYRCALDEVRGNFPPEEGDFNSARIISGEMSEKEARWLQEDLEAVEAGRSIREVEEEVEYFDWCDKCGEMYCCCDEPE